MAKKREEEVFQKKILEPRTAGQADYIRCIAENDVTICIGPAGTGKSAIACGLAARWLAEKKIDKIVLCRPIVESGPSIGFLPGDAGQKCEPYTAHMYDELKKYISYTDVAGYQNIKAIEFIPTVFLQGKTFDRAFMIMDEAQNATEDELMLFLTRMGKYSNVVVNGDPAQSYLMPAVQGALEKAARRMKGIRGIGTVQLTNADIVRHRLVGEMILAMKG